LGVDVQPYHGFVPASIPNLNLAALPTLLTSMFLHGDLIHLLGNMPFLLILGRKLETQLERLNFIALYFASGITAAMTHTLMEPDSYGPLIGASGAISGVLGTFFIYNPRARITLILEPVLIYFLRRLTIRLPAWIFLPIWFSLQISMALKPQIANVAFWAHVGGFVAGAVMTAAVYKYIPREDLSPRRPKQHN
jgi:membrane associated rhomboid family serine protease